MTTHERFDDTHKAVTFMGLDAVTNWFGEAVGLVKCQSILVGHHLGPSYKSE